MTPQCAHAWRPAMASVLLAAALVAAPTGPVQPVAAGEIFGCFGQSCYGIVTTQATWPDAVAYCEARDGHLVTINSAEENEVVYNLMPSTYLGASHETEEGTWEWVTGEPFTYTNWAPGEPTNWSPYDELPENVLTFWGDTYPGQWNDVPGTNESGFVCEYENPNPGMGLFVGPDFTTRYVAGWNFTADGIVTLRIDHDADGSIDYQDQGVAFSDGYVVFNAAGHFMVAGGDRVRLTDDGGLAKEMLAQYVTLDVLDPAAQVLAGAAHEGSDVSVVVGTAERQENVATVTADASERWTADLGAQGFDLQQGMQGWLELVDPDESGNDSPDYTWLDWNLVGVPGRLAQLQTVATNLELQPPAAGNGLLAKVANAQRSYERGNVAAACSQLTGLVGQVKDFEGAGKLTPEEAVDLRLSAIWTQLELGC